MWAMSEREDHAFAPFVVAIICFLFVFISYVFRGFSSLSLISPWLLPCVVAYFAMMRPSYTPHIYLFLLGLLEDGLAGVPFGLHSLGLLMMYQMIIYQRHYLEHSPFPVIWTSFAFNMLIVYVTQTFLMWIATGVFSLWVLGSYLFSLVLFPFIFMLMAHIHQSLIKE